jgi:dephospho-CoA kinase
MYLIGLTGGIACGKSTVIAQLNELGAHTIDADRVTHQVQQPGTATYQAIVAAFGEAILSAPDGPIDRKALGAIVFADQSRLRELEQIVHPAVRTEIRSWLDSLAVNHNDKQVIAVIDAIKLIESRWIEQCDAVWVVTCRPEQQIERLMATRGMSEAEARARIAAQPPQESRLPYATVVIDNSGIPEETQAQILAAWDRIPQKRQD